MFSIAVMEGAGAICKTEEEEMRKEEETLNQTEEGHQIQRHRQGHGGHGHVQSGLGHG